MKKNLLILFALALSAVGYAQDAVKVKVTGDRVSLRAAPEVTAVLLDRAMTGDELILQDNSHPDWVGVLPPEAVDLWVSSEFISSNTVQPRVLNIRSGPSSSHSIVGTARSGEVVRVRGEVAQWLRIAPTSNTVVWISRKYVNAPVTVSTADPVEAVATGQNTQAVVQATAEPVIQDIMMVTIPGAKTPKKLEPDPGKKQGVVETFSGVLRPTGSILYRLADDHFEDITVCYVRGNQMQMRAYAHLPLRITGKIYWAAGLDLPLIVPATIEILNTVPNG